MVPVLALVAPSDGDPGLVTHCFYFLGLILALLSLVALFFPLWDLFLLYFQGILHKSLDPGLGLWFKAGYLEHSSSTLVDSGMGVGYGTGRAMRPHPDILMELFERHSFFQDC